MSSRKPDPTEENAKALARMKDELGIDPSVSPDKLRGALKRMVADKKIADYRINSEK